MCMGNVDSFSWTVTDARFSTRVPGRLTARPITAGILGRIRIHVFWVSRFVHSSKPKLVVSYKHSDNCCDRPSPYTPYTPSLQQAYPCRFGRSVAAMSEPRTSHEKLDLESPQHREVRLGELSFSTRKVKALNDSSQDTYSIPYLANHQDHLPVSNRSNQSLSRSPKAMVLSIHLIRLPRFSRMTSFDPSQRIPSSACIVQRRTACSRRC